MSEYEGFYFLFLVHGRTQAGEEVLEPACLSIHITHATRKVVGLGTKFGSTLGQNSPLLLASSEFSGWRWRYIYATETYPWRHRCKVPLETTWDATARWGDLRAALHAGDWHRVRDILYQTPPPLRHQMTRYVQDFWPDEPMHLPMLGKTFVSVKVGPFPERAREQLLENMGSKWRWYVEWHEQYDRLHPLEMLGFEADDGSFCALVPPLDRSEFWIEDIHGDLEDLVGTPILEARVLRSTLRGEDDDIPRGFGFERYTFYHFATHKGRVTVRWCATSSGWYATDVDVLEIPAPGFRRIRLEDWEDMY